MMKKILLTLLASLTIAMLHAQAPAIQWQHSYGGSSNENASPIQQTADGGYIVAGYTYSFDGDVTGNHGADDYWIVKLDATGGITWQKSLGGSANDYAYAVQQTADGGYIIGGTSSSSDGDVTGNHGGSDYWIVKLDATGGITWQKSLGGSDREEILSIAQTADGGYIAAGNTHSSDGDVTSNHGGADYWIVKLDATGGITWQKSLGGSDDDYAYAVQQTVDGGYIVAGSSSSADGDVTGNHSYMDYWIVKLDATGGITWQKSLGGSDEEYPYSIQQTADGGYIVAGSSRSSDGNVTGNHGFSDYWIVKLDATGSITWQKSLGGSNSDIATSIRQTADGGYIVAGNSTSVNGDATSNHGAADYWIVKLDDTGGIIWQKSFGGGGNDMASAIQQTTDGGYIVAGKSFSADGDVTGNHGHFDYWIVKLGGNSTRINDIDKGKFFSLYPNPAKVTLKICIAGTVSKNGTVSISDVSGRVLQTITVTANEQTIDISALPAGTYNLQYNDGVHNEAEMFMVE